MTLQVNLHTTDSLSTIYSDNEGNMYWSQSSLGTVTKTDHTRVRREIQKGNIKVLGNVQVLTEKGLQNANIIPCEDKGVIAFIAKYNPELVCTFAGIGATAFLRKEAGLNVDTPTLDRQVEEAKLTFNPYRAELKSHDSLINMKHGAIYDEYCKAYYALTTQEWKEKYGVDNGSDLSYLPDVAPRETWEVHRILREALASTNPRGSRKETIEYALKKAKKNIAKLTK